jgi:propionate CoA-transferase
VFALTPNGLELREVAPGIDIERDILAQMDFKPIVINEPGLMDARIFGHEPQQFEPNRLRLAAGPCLRVCYSSSRSNFLSRFQICKPCRSIT